MVVWSTLILLPRNGERGIVNAITGVQLQRWLVCGHIKLDTRVFAPHREYGFIPFVIIIYPAVIETITAGATIIIAD